MGDVKEVQLRRMDNSAPWGFKLKGGVDMGMPLHVEMCNPKGRAAASGLGAGDTILSICGTNITQMNSSQIKQEMLRAGNDLDLVVRKGGMAGHAPGGPVGAAAAPSNEPRVQVVEESIPSLGGPKFKDVKPKTYQILEDELPASEQGAAPKPASIFNRKKQERSGYLQAKGQTIQKAYGED